VENLVVRRLRNGRIEVLSGNQRLFELKESGAETAPCVIVDLDDSKARLLAQALNHIHGEDDLGLRAELLKDVLRSIAEDEVLDILPETQESLQALATLGQEDLAEHLAAWQAAQSARLKHLQVQLTASQLEVVEEALRHFKPAAREQRQGNPNTRGTALYLLCQTYLKRSKEIR
jgi:ParB family chromosome partitioning protein